MIPGVEDMVNEKLSAMAFCGLQIENDVPDHCFVSRFRSEFTKKRAFNRMLIKINAQLEKKMKDLRMN